VKTHFVISIILFVFLLTPSHAFAKVWINEFSSNGSDDWVELFNDGSEPLNLEIYRIRDSSATNKLDLTGQIDAGGYATFDWKNKLNNSGDTIKLVSASDENSVIDKIVYGNSGDIFSPASGQSAGRETDGGSVLSLFAAPSKNGTNVDAQAAPTPTSLHEKTPTPVKEPTPTKTPTPTKIPTPTKTPTPKPSPSPTPTENTVKDSLQVTKNPTSKRSPITGVPTSILGIATTAAPKAKLSPKPTGTLMVKSAVAPPYFILISGTIFCIACGILVVLQRRRRNKES
jgi:hypothetical protein